MAPLVLLAYRSVLKGDLDSPTEGEIHGPLQLLHLSLEGEGGLISL